MTGDDFPSSGARIGSCVSSMARPRPAQHLSISTSSIVSVIEGSIDSSATKATSHESQLLREGRATALHASFTYVHLALGTKQTDIATLDIGAI